MVELMMNIENFGHYESSDINFVHHRHAKSVDAVMNPTPLERTIVALSLAPSYHQGHTLIGSSACIVTLADD